MSLPRAFKFWKKKLKCRNMQDVCMILRLKSVQNDNVPTIIFLKCLLCILVGGNSEHRRSWVWWIPARSLFHPGFVSAGLLDFLQKHLWPDFLYFTNESSSQKWKLKLFSHLKIMWTPKMLPNLCLISCAMNKSPLKTTFSFLEHLSYTHFHFCQNIFQNFENLLTPLPIFKVVAFEAGKEEKKDA